MEWHEPQLGDTRIRKVFIGLPKTIQKTTRMLMVSNIKQRYTWVQCEGFGNQLGWKSVAWTDENADSINYMSFVIVYGLFISLAMSLGILVKGYL